MKENNMDIRIKTVTKSDYTFLYELLKGRDLISNISHKKMPKYSQHVKFVVSRPYSRWYVIFVNNNRCGSVYLSKLNEIGIHLKKGYRRDEIEDKVLKLLTKRNPRKRFLANVNPRDVRKRKFFTSRGFRLIQYTYELMPKGKAA